ncbi:acyltransferase [Leyella stercorea]|uniref:acyltransferase n=1 Tax=Leyella stercorea TaxID=363265 RepID=UPI0024306ED5|nr:acyltransferase [Leyella stercorea]
MRWLNIIRKYYYCLLILVSTAIQQIGLLLRGIKCKHCKFVGLSTIYNTQGSIINIGNGCTFNSTHSWNLLGVNRKCIVSTLTKNARIYIGANCGFSGVSIGAFDSIRIGENCLFGANVVVTDSDWHCLIPEQRFTGKVKTAAVNIGNNVFIGANALILKGSVIGDNSVIGAGSVVSGTIPSDVIAAGNPCKIIRHL